MVPWLTVIDDFLQKPDKVRANALALTYAVKGRYPGLNSIEKIAFPGLENVISSLVHQPVHAPWAPDFSHQNCRLSLASDDTPGRVHIDLGQWTGVLCLSRDEDCRGGTEFYRHKRTGTDRLPMDATSLNAAGYSSYDEIRTELLDKDGPDPSKWERTLSVPLRFNRLILLQSHYWHTAGPGFGTTVEDGRLVYLMFFKRGAAPAVSG